MVRTGQTWTGMVATRDATGALVAAGAGPAGALYVNGVLNAAVVTIAGANPYSWSVTLPALAATDCVSMYITATIAGIATGSVVCEDVADTIFVSDGVTVNAIGNNVVTAAAIAANAITSSELAQSAAQEIADEVLSRGVNNVETTADTASLAELILAAFESAISGTSWYIYQTDHATNFNTRTVTTSDCADPIVEVT